jgi:hypothetical protein
MRNSNLCLTITLTLLSLSTSVGAQTVVCQIITPTAGGMIPAPQLESIVKRTAKTIVDNAQFRHVGISDALEACGTNVDIDRCVSSVVTANHAALISDMKSSADAGYLIMTGRITESGTVEGTSVFIPPDGQYTAVTFMLEPLDAHQRPRRHLNEQRGRAEWFAADSTYLLQTAACDVAHRLGFAAAEKHIKIRAFDQQNGFDDGTIDWGGSAIVH